MTHVSCVFVRAQRVSLRELTQPHLEPRSALAQQSPARIHASATARLTTRTRARTASTVGNFDPVFHIEGVQQAVSEIDAEHFVMAFPEIFWTGVASNWCQLLLAEDDAASRTLKPSFQHPWSLGLWFRRWCTWSPVVHVVTEVYARRT